MAKSYILRLRGLLYIVYLTFYVGPSANYPSPLLPGALEFISEIIFTNMCDNTFRLVNDPKFGWRGK